MDTIGKFFKTIWEIYTFQHGMYFNYYGERDSSAIVLLCIVYAGTGLMIALFVFIFGPSVKWRMQRKRCQHDWCSHQWTTDVSGGSAPSCIDGQPCCAGCNNRHIDEAMLRDANREPKRTCSGCGHQMVKFVAERVIQDVCESCGGVFLDEHEKEKLIELARKAGYNSGYSHGRSAGSSNGMVVGIAIGSAIN